MPPSSIRPISALVPTLVGQHVDLGRPGQHDAGGAAGEEAEHDHLDRQVRLARARQDEQDRADRDQEDPSRIRFGARIVSSVSATAVATEHHRTMPGRQGPQPQVSRDELGDHRVSLHVGLLMKCMLEPPIAGGIIRPGDLLRPKYGVKSTAASRSFGTKPQAPHVRAPSDRSRSSADVNSTTRSGWTQVSARANWRSAFVAEMHVDEHPVRHEPLDDTERVPMRVGLGDDVVAPGVEKLTCGPAEGGVVVDDQDAGGHAVHTGHGPLPPSIPQTV